MTKLFFSQNLTNSHFLSSESINYISDKLIVGSRVKGQGEWTGKGALRQLKRGGLFTTEVDGVTRMRTGTSRKLHLTDGGKLVFLRPTQFH